MVLSLYSFLQKDSIVRNLYWKGTADFVSLILISACENSGKNIPRHGRVLAGTHPINKLLFFHHLGITHHHLLY